MRLRQQHAPRAKRNQNRKDHAPRANSVKPAPRALPWKFRFHLSSWFERIHIASGIYLSSVNILFRTAHVALCTFPSKGKDTPGVHARIPHQSIPIMKFSFVELDGSSVLSKAPRIDRDSIPRSAGHDLA